VLGLPVKVCVWHQSGQYSIPGADQLADEEKVFRAARKDKALFVTGTETQQPDDIARFRKAASKYDFLFVHRSGDVWVALDVRRCKPPEIEWTKVIPGRAGAHPDRGVLRVTFETNLNIGVVTVLVAHYDLTPSKRHGGTGPQDNPKIAAEIQRQAQIYGAGNALVFYGGDQNLHDDKADTFFGGQMISVWDRLGKYPPTHPGPETIDVIAWRPDQETRVSLMSADSLTDAEGFKLVTDHYPIKALFKIKQVRSRRSH
jgi:hypothetical protein